MFSPKNYAYLAAMVLITTVSARADLIGTSVTGSLQFGSPVPPNWFDPANGFVPVGPLNKTFGTTVTIGGGVEFGFLESGNSDSANFDGSTLTITDATIAGSGVAFYTFTNAAFSGLALTKTFDNFTSGVTGNLTGNTLTVTHAEFTSAPRTFQAVFSLSASAPEPQSIVFMATGLGLLGLLARRIR